MLPEQLQASDFATYQPDGRKLAAGNVDLLRRMPLAFLPLLLREVVGFDWKFPIEREELLEQFRYLRKLDANNFQAEMAPFAAIQLSPQLQQAPWITEPAEFSEKLSAHLWATHQIEAFRAASIVYVNKLNAWRGERKPAQPRLCVVVMGRDVTSNNYPLFRKLRRQGAYFPDVDPAGGREAVLQVLRRRAQAAPAPYAHWYVDGGEGVAVEKAACVSYANLQPARDRLITRMRQVMAPGGDGPEALRSIMARMAPEELGFSDGSGDALLNRFELSVLTEGSGTQIFSTTFVQWTAREVLRRAQPLTLVLRYAPRQREQSMQEMLSGKQHTVEFDPEGSLIDADMGAYYTWLNSARLPQASSDCFIAWFEAGREAVCVGPEFEKNSESRKAMTLAALLELTSRA